MLVKMSCRLMAIVSDEAGQDGIFSTQGLTAPLATVSLGLYMLVNCNATSKASTATPEN
jgi:hypothetical protein